MSATARCSAVAGRAELGHGPEDGHAAAGVERRQGAQGGRHRGGVGVVGVVEQRGAGRRASAAPSASGDTAARAQRRGHARERHLAGQGGGGGRHRVLHHVAAPDGEARPRRRPTASRSRNDGRSSSSSTTRSARTSPPVAEGHDPGSGAARHRRHPRVGRVEHRRPGRPAGPPPARPWPGRPRRATPNVAGVGRGHPGHHRRRSGRAIAHRAATWPGPRAPISTTSASVPSAAPSSVRGTPSSLLNELALAAVSEPGGQGGGQQVLDAGLADRAGDADDPVGQAVAGGAAEGAEGDDGVVDHDGGAPRPGPGDVR